MELRLSSFPKNLTLPCCRLVPRYDGINQPSRLTVPFVNKNCITQKQHRIEFDELISIMWFEILEILTLVWFRNL